MTREGAAEAAGHDGEWRRKKENWRRGTENDEEREKRGETEREIPNGIFGKWNEEIKGFSLSATHG